MADRVATVDFETKPIESRPNYPPEPVGLAIREVDGTKKYLAWGHPTGNNSTMLEARRELARIYASGDEVLFHNGAFDMDVAEIHMGLPMPKNRGDSLFLAFLHNPYARDLGLKPLATELLNMPPDEKDALTDWLTNNIKEVKRSPRRAGEFIWRAPAGLTGEYAIGDVVRTYKLRQHLLPRITKDGMLPAYQRELALAPITLEMERSGIRVARKRLKKLRNDMELLDEWIMGQVRGKLRVGYDFNVNSGAQLADALLKANKLDSIVKTKTGRVSTKVANLQAGCNDKELLSLLSVHSVCEKYLSSFIRPWLEQSAVTGGRILPSFNQTRGDSGGGARTGRYSSSDPNLQNISANVEDSANRENLELLQKWLLEKTGNQFIGLRDYLLPDEGKIICCIDFNQQELRMLAHFENDSLLAAYLKDAGLDVHTYIQQLIKTQLGVEYPRKHVKVTVFGILYGMGVNKLAARLGIDYQTAKKLRDAIYAAIPGIRRLQGDLSRLSRLDKPLVTWGGRRYMCEEPRYMLDEGSESNRGQWISFEYKMLNYLIQGSSADCTKQAMINVNRDVPEARIAIQVHDELVCMVSSIEEGNRVAKAMCDLDMRVPMMAEPKFSTKSWARAKVWTT